MRSLGFTLALVDIRRGASVPDALKVTRSSPPLETHDANTGGVRLT